VGNIFSGITGGPINPPNSAQDEANAFEGHI